MQSGLGLQNSGCCKTGLSCAVVGMAARGGTAIGGAVSGLAATEGLRNGGGSTWVLEGSRKIGAWCGWAASLDCRLHCAPGRRRMELAPAAHGDGPKGRQPLAAGQPSSPRRLADAEHLDGTLNFHRILSCGVLNNATLGIALGLPARWNGASSGGVLGLRQQPGCAAQPCSLYNPSPACWPGCPTLSYTGSMRVGRKAQRWDVSCPPNNQQHACLASATHQGWEMRKKTGTDRMAPTMGPTTNTGTGIGGWERRVTRTGGGPRMWRLARH